MKFEPSIECSDIRNANWSAHEFRRDTLCALLIKTHSLSNSSSIAFEDLKQYPLILEENRTSFRAYVDKTFEAYGCTPIVAGESNYSLLAENLKRKPHAIGLTTSLTAENKWYEKVDYLSHIPIAGMDADRGFSLFWKNDAPSRMQQWLSSNISKKQKLFSGLHGHQTDFRCNVHFPIRLSKGTEQIAAFLLCSLPRRQLFALVEGDGVSHRSRVDTLWVPASSFGIKSHK